MKKCYFVLPSTAYSPGGCIVLGSILSHPAEPENSVNRNDIAPLPPRLPIDKATEYDAVRETASSRGVDLGLFAKWMEGMGLDLSGTRNKSNADTYNFERLERSFFAPDTAYAEEALRVPKVEQYIREAGFQTNLFMVTGIQVAYGASRSESQSSGGGVNATFGLDLTAVGAPGASIGPKAAWSGSKSETSSFGRSTDFVYAYRVQEILYRKTKVKLGAVQKGQTYSQEDDEEIERQRRISERDQKMGGDFEVTGIPAGDIDLEEIGLASEPLFENTDNQHIVVWVE